MQILVYLSKEYTSGEFDIPKYLVDSYNNYSLNIEVTTLILFDSYFDVSCRC